MISWLKKLFAPKKKKVSCDHDWQWFTVPSEGPFAVISGERRVLACPKCQAVDETSEYFHKYD